MSLPSRAIYGIINKVSDQEHFIEFARDWLKLREHEINHIKEKYQGQPRESKFQMIKKWEMKTGRDATQGELYRIYNEYCEDMKKDQPTNAPQTEDATRNEPTQQNNSVGRNEGRPMQQYSTNHPRSANAVGQTMDQPSSNQAPAMVQNQPPFPQQYTTQHSRHFTNHPTQDTTQHSATVSGQLLNTGHTGYLSAGAATHATNISQSAGSIPNLDPRIPGPPVAHIPQPAAVFGQPGAPSSSVQVEQNQCYEVHQVTVRQSTLEQNQKILQEHDNLYQMNYNKGLAVIINNNFGGERNGARHDVDHMKVMWTQLGCEIILEEDQTCDQIREILRKVANWTKKFNYLVIVIMSHGGMSGDTEVILDCEGYPLSVKEILFQFKNAQSPNWIGIPKCFFFQFCRGPTIDQGIEPDLENVFSSLSLYQNELDQADYINNSHCEISDMFISYATLAGNAAYRNSRGSWFINAITNIFMTYACKEHLHELMIRVREAVGDQTGLTTLDDGSIVTCKEMSESVDRLSKKLFLLLKTSSNQQNPQN